MDGRKNNLSQFTDSVVTMLLSGEITNPLAYELEGEALPDKTHDKLNFYQNLLPESQQIPACEMRFQCYDFRKDRETLLQDVTPFPPKDFERQLFSSTFSFASHMLFFL